MTDSTYHIILRRDTDFFELPLLFIWVTNRNALLLIVLRPTELIHFRAKYGASLRAAPVRENNKMRCNVFEQLSIRFNTLFSSNIFRASSKVLWTLPRFCKRFRTFSERFGRSRRSIGNFPSVPYPARLVTRKLESKDVTSRKRE